MKKLEIYIGGDVCPTENNEKFFISGEIEKFLDKKIINILSSSDFNIFNFETTLHDGWSPIKKCGPNLRCNTDCIRGLKKLNPTLIGLANNHSLDHGDEALLNTISLLKENEIGVVGAGINLREAVKSYIFEKNGYKIGIYACAEHEFTIAGDNKPGANPFDPLYSLDHIHALKEQCDFVFVLYHGGKEFYRYPSPEVQRICRRMVDKGADLVVTQHTHCIGCREDYLSGVIIYGQGNFIFDQGDILSEDDMALTTSMLLLHVIVEGNKLFVKEIPMTLEKNYIKIPDNNMYDELIQEYEGRSDDIKQNGFVENKYGEFANKMLKHYLHWFVIGNNLFVRIINRLLNRKLVEYMMNEKRYLAFRNYIECEAHRELLLKGINNKIKKECIL